MPWTKPGCCPREPDRTQRVPPPLKMKHIVIKGEPACLSQGFHLLKTGSVARTVETIEGQMERQFQMIDLEQFDPIANEYKDLGQHWADSVTGSLYNPKTGECLTSTQIRMIV